MDSIELTDDDDSFLQITQPEDETTILSSDKENYADIISSDDDLPEVNMAIQEKKSAHIKNLFLSSSKTQNKVKEISRKLQDFKRVLPPSMPLGIPAKPRDPGINKMIEGINVNLPVNPYGCQVALMSMVRICVVILRQYPA